MLLTAGDMNLKEVELLFKSGALAVPVIKT